MGPEGNYGEYESHFEQTLGLGALALGPLPILDALQEVTRVLPGRRDAGAFMELAADLAERTDRTIDSLTDFREPGVREVVVGARRAARQLLEV